MKNYNCRYKKTEKYLNGNDCVGVSPVRMDSPSCDIYRLSSLLRSLSEPSPCWRAVGIFRKWRARVGSGPALDPPKKGLCRTCLLGGACNKYLQRAITKNGNIHDCVKLRRGFSLWYRLCMYYFLSVHFLSLISESCYHLNLPLTVTDWLVIMASQLVKSYFMSTG